ncbi:hypothetical protein [Rhodococcoides trifolii]|uniref:hypothetical protein n=1 Tax=Rhodococcoides trifolii TaxID=908250 RepID=UPI001664D9ED|nr:hypothetical protein [Rhodococcus trifolii]
MIAPTAEEWETASDVDKEYATTMAVHLLWTLTGRVLGTFPAAVRPCFGTQEHTTAWRGNGVRDGYWWPGLVAGTGTSGACGCADGCDCFGVNQLMLPGPVASVTRVLIDGVVVPSSAYKVKDRRWLFRTDGQGWPQAQDLTAADTAVGAFLVEYQRGVPVPAAGLVAAADLAVDLLRARLNKPCKIPSRAQNVSRQGIEVQLIDPYTLFESGLTGLPSVDQWISAVNPSRLRSRSRVYSPDAQRVSRFR